MPLEDRNKASLSQSTANTGGKSNTYISDGMICRVYYSRNAKLMTRILDFKNDLGI